MSDDSGIAAAIFGGCIFIGLILLFSLNDLSWIGDITIDTQTIFDWIDRYKWLIIAFAIVFFYVFDFTRYYNYWSYYNNRKEYAIKSKSIPKYKPPITRFIMNGIKNVKL